MGLLCGIATFIADPTSYLASGTQTTLQTNGRTFGSKSATIDFEGPNIQAITINTIPVDTGDPASDSGAVAMSEALWPEFKNVTNLAFYSGSSLTVADDQGNDITSDLGTYKYILLDPHVPQWLLTDPQNGPLCKQATFSGTFTYTENAVIPGGSITKGSPQFHEKHARATLIRIPGGTYEQELAGEVVPYGLAGFVFNIESIPQYEGSFTLQEPEITDVCPIGNLLNLTGSANAEWATMNACIQSVDYDITAGRTTLTFGPAVHLGAKDFVEQLRANRGPRWYYLVGGNMTNGANQNSNTQMAPTNVAQRGPSAGGRVPGQEIDHTSLADSLTNIGTYGGANNAFPGITTDLRSTQPLYGYYVGLYSDPEIVGGPGGQTIHMQHGTGGVYDGFMLLSPKMLTGADDDGNPMALTARLLDWCQLVDGELTPGYRYVLCSQFFEDYP